MKNIFTKTLIILSILSLSFVLSSCDETGNGNNNNVKEGIVKVKIKDKDIKRYSDSDKYLVFTDKGTYKITDSLLNGRFNSSDMYGRLEIGKCYNLSIDALSFRIAVTSSYENIISAYETPCDDEIIEETNTIQNNNIECPLFGETSIEICNKFSKCLDNDTSRVEMCKDIVQ